MSKVGIIGVLQGFGNQVWVAAADDEDGIDRNQIEDYQSRSSRNFHN